MQVTEVKTSSAERNCLFLSWDSVFYSYVFFIFVGYKTILNMQETATKTDNISYDDFKNQVLKDYKTAVVSRECSLLGRREVLTGKAKFGIFGDGKEVPQIAMAKVFKNGDFRSGYYRD